MLQKDNGLPRASRAGGGRVEAAGGVGAVAKQSGNQNINLKQKLENQDKPNQADTSARPGHFSVLSPTFLFKKSKPHEKVSGEWFGRGHYKKEKNAT